MSSADLAALITGPPAVYVPSLVSLPRTGGRCGRRAGEGRVLCFDVQDDALERLAWEITVQDSNAEGSQRGEIIVLTLGAGEWGASEDGFMSADACNLWSAVFRFSCLNIHVSHVCCSHQGRLLGQGMWENSGQDCSKNCRRLLLNPPNLSRFIL